MILLVPTDSKYQWFLGLHWPHVSPDLFIPDKDVGASFEVTPERFALRLRIDDGQAEQFEAEHTDSLWVEACLTAGKIVVLVGPPQLEVATLADDVLVNLAQQGKLSGAYVPVTM
jgi:hypothetical protein